MTTQCETCEKEKETLFRTIGGRPFCSSQCLNEFLYKTDRQVLEVKVLRQRRPEPKSRLKRLKEALIE